MTDRLTQLQDAIDQLALQFVACLHYVNAHHDYGLLGEGDSVRKTDKKDGESLPEPIEPYNTDEFKAGLHELAHDLILKEQQIEYLIPVLPGLEKSERDQRNRIAELEVQLRAAEREREKALEAKAAMMERVDAAIRSIKRP